MSSDRRVALITGGSRGIGKAIAERLSADGIVVYLTYRVEEALAMDVCDRIRAKGGKAQCFQLDLISREQIDQLVDTIVKIEGKCDVLVNNAGYGKETPFEEITDDDWDHMLHVNLWSMFALSQRIIPLMITQQWGRIINLSSIGGQWGGVKQVHYAVAKAGVIGLTRSLAKIYSKHSITINALSPGLVHTDAAANEIDSKLGDKKKELTPIGRFAMPEELAGVASFLVSGDASYITGQTINVNGGMYFG